ncbi:hypothetical protein M409DRAFT_26362 [Zasmidium cellare ATCC 36951]|uniref:F-box domain-containing protein n=1 Tax=Zasmidium cellare ATCC 36951 TaxID=1080233 RepID=A0A6A6C8G3_ZASCE|nr:uncharacterized protein M409DRAFT_26362 [Zasmidium cellare ATCC 36951]KAF2163325.1 hypothetical protein M409DRAFT_26362 [Zasmidium cellare ATCC 36951]
MDRLPNEISDNILQSLSIRDVKSVRLACRSCAAMGAPHLFPRVWLSSHPLDVQIFRMVVRNPLICRGVKELIWDDTTYCDSLMEKKKYLETAKHFGSWGSWCTDLYPRTEGEYGYWLFFEKAQLHHHIRRKRKDERLLLSALPKLQKLKSVVLSSRHHYMPAPDDLSYGESPTARLWPKERLFKTFAYPPTVNWKAVRKAGSNSEPKNDDLRQMMTVDYHHDAWDKNELTDASCVHVQRPWRGLLILLRALSNTEKPIESFEIRPQFASKWGEDNSMVGISHYFFRQRSADLERFIAIARHLRKLNLVVSCEGAGLAEGRHASAIRTVKQGHLTRLLQSAENLEELHFELPVPNVMKTIGTQAHYPRLKNLSLMQGIVEPLELVDLLKKHRRTIQSLTLSHCNSSNESWKELFEQLKTEDIYLSIEVDFLFEPDGVSWCRTMEPHDINAFFTGNGPVPLRLSTWRGSPPPRF